MTPQIKTPHKVNANELLSMLDDEALARLASSTDVDFHARKLKGDILLRLHLQGVLLYGDRLSLSTMKSFYESGYFIEAYESVQGVSISKAALSKRISSINAEYFRGIYENAVQAWGPILEKEHVEVIPGLELEAVDSTLVRQTAKILKGGVPVGGKGDSKKGVKYTMAFNGMFPTYAAAHIESAYGSEDKALGEALVSMSAPNRLTGSKELFLIDRGLASAERLNDIKSRDISFICRVNNNRRSETVRELEPNLGDLPSEATVLSDNAVRIYGKNPHKPFPQLFRLTKVDLGHPVGKPRYNKTAGSDSVITLLTDDMDLSVSELLEAYRFRWKIEVFFKFLKQNLDFSHLMSGSHNGLTVLLYLTLIEALLVKAYCVLNHARPKAATTRIWLEIGSKIIDYVSSHVNPQEPKMTQETRKRSPVNQNKIS